MKPPFCQAAAAVEGTDLRNKSADCAIAQGNTLVKQDNTRDLDQ